jgi:hypothetical protein
VNITRFEWVHVTAVYKTRISLYTDYVEENVVDINADLLNIINNIPLNNAKVLRDSKNRIVEITYDDINSGFEIAYEISYSLHEKKCSNLALAK